MTTSRLMSYIHLTLTFAWALAIIPTLLWWKESVLWVAVMSLWANVASHWAAYQSTRGEIKQDER